MKDAKTTTDEEKKDVIIQSSKVDRQEGLGINEINHITSEMRKDLTLSQQKQTEINRD